MVTLSDVVAPVSLLEGVNVTRLHQISVPVLLLGVFPTAFMEVVIMALSVVGVQTEHVVQAQLSLEEPAVLRQVIIHL